MERGRARGSGRRGRCVALAMRCCVFLPSLIVYTERGRTVVCRSAIGRRHEKKEEEEKKTSATKKRVLESIVKERMAYITLSVFSLSSSTCPLIATRQLLPSLPPSLPPSLLPLGG